MSKCTLQRHKFGDFLLDPDERLLLKDGAPIPLTRKAFDTLWVLVCDAGRLVEKAKIIEEVWPDSFVGDATLTQNVFTLRKILGESPGGGPYIETVSGRGYRFAARVEVVRDSFPWPHRLTFRRGSIQAARFRPDGHGVVYGAAWEGRPYELFSADSDAPESRPLHVADAGLLGVSARDELAVALGRRLLRGYISTGTLARVTPGGSRQNLLEGVQYADWSPCGDGLAVVREAGGRARLEYPAGRVLYETGGWISHPRFSPAGDLIAFLDHPVQNDDRGSVAIVKVGGGAKETLSNSWISLYGLAWAASGREVWFTAARLGNARALRAITLAGQERLIERGYGSLTLHDISREGRVLLTHDQTRLGINGVGPGEDHERDLSWLDWSLARDVSSDGGLLLFTEAGEAGRGSYGVYVRRTDGSPAVRLGDGSALTLAPDGARALVKVSDPASRLALLPIGGGAPEALNPGGITHQQWAVWSHDGGRVFFTGTEAGHGSRLYAQRAAAGHDPVVLTPDTEGVQLSSPHALAPDGASIVALSPDRKFYFFPIEPGPEPREVPGLDDLDLVIRWSADARYLYLFRRGEVPAKIYRLDLREGRKEERPLRETMMTDRAGVHEIFRVLLTPDARSYFCTFVRDLSDLYQVDGLK